MYKLFFINLHNPFLDIKIEEPAEINGKNDIFLINIPTCIFLQSYRKKKAVAMENEVLLVTITFFFEFFLRNVGLTKFGTA